MDAGLKLLFFGSLQILHPEQGELPFKGRKAKALLVYLLLEPQKHRRDVLAGLFFADMSAQKARSNLSVVLSRLSRALGEHSSDYFLADKKTVQLNPDVHFDLDVLAFDRLFVDCEAHDHETRATCEACHGRLIRATELYKGDFLTGFHLDGAQAFEEWLQIKREQYCLKATSIFADLAQYYETAQQFAAAELYSKQHLKLEPFADVVHRRLMRVLYFQGQGTRALEHYDACREVFLLELGFEPELETTALYKQIKAKSFDLPEHLRTQSLAAEQRNPIAHLAPMKPNFVGRDTELEQLELLVQGSRLVTLLGLGGVGKTELALRLAHRQKKRLAESVVFVAVEDLVDPELMYVRIAEALGLRVKSSASGSQGALQQLSGFIGSRAILLIIDAAENLVNSSPKLSYLLKHCPRLSILVTSRESLQLEQEQRMRLQGFPVPKSTALLEVRQSYAVQLFVKQAQRHKADFVLNDSNAATLVKICRLLEGLPLGLELAAVWVEILPLEEIVHELSSNLDFLKNQQRDAPERHRSIRAVFEHAWQRLEPKEKHIMQDLAVFRGGFRRHAAQTIAKASLSDMANLSHKALLNLQVSGRYGLHALINQYSLEKLKENNSHYEQAKDRHAKYFFELLHDRFDTTLASFNQEDLALLSEEDANLYAAWQWLIERQDWHALETSLAALSRFIVLRSRQQEALIWFSDALNTIRSNALQTATNKTLERCEAKLLVYKSLMMFPLGNYPEVTKSAQTGLEHCQNLDLKAEAALAFNILGNCALFLGQREQAKVLYTQALTEFKSLNHYEGIGKALNNLAIVARRNGDYSKAKQLYEQCLKLRREKADVRNIAVTLTNLATLERYGFKRLNEAESIYLEALSLRRDVNDAAGQMSSLNSLGSLACDQNDYLKAAPYLEEGLEISERIGHLDGRVIALTGLGRVTAQTDTTKAIKLWLKTLRISQKSGSMGHQLITVSLIAKHIKESHPKYAAVWLSVVTQHPNATKVQQNRAQEALDTLSPNIMPQKDELMTLEAIVDKIFSFDFTKHTDFKESQPVPIH